ncbi:MAG: cysteine hydrolase [Campylobacteraceae bacterium]|nr:cysteine hydrolase [Campylobacteraceae bacterium]
MKNLLVVIDVQNDFIDGALGFEGASDIVPHIIEKIKEYEARGDDIIFTLDTHGSCYMSSIEGSFLPIEHCIKGTHGHEIYKELKPYTEKYPVIEKPSFGSFEFGEMIKDKNYKNIELCGLVSNICVISNAVIAKAASMESNIIVDKKATSSNDLEMQEMAFKVMKNLHINVV